MHKTPTHTHTHPHTHTHTQVFNGVLINVSDLPYGSRWVADIGYNRYAFEALAINEFRDRAYPCGDTADPAACVTNGNQILKLYTYQDGKIGFCILWMVVVKVL
jgi:hypothetical protein